MTTSITIDSADPLFPSVLALLGAEAPAPAAKKAAPAKASKKVEEPEDDDEDDDLDDAPEEYTEKDLKAKGIADLRKIADEFDIEHKGLKKPDLIEAILDAQDEEADDEDADDDDDDLDDDDDDLDDDDEDDDDEDDEPAPRRGRGRAKR